MGINIFDFLKKEPKVNVKIMVEETDEQKQLFFDAVNNEDHKTIIKMLNEGFDINTKNQLGLTPLMNAAFNGNVKTAEFLIKKGADVKMKDDTGKTVFYYACRTNEVKLAKILLPLISLKDEFECDDTLLFYCINENILEIAELLIKNGFEVNNVNRNGYTPLMSSIFRNNIKIAELLVKHGANIDATTEVGKTMLMYSIEINNLWMAKLLLDNGADVHAKDISENDAMYYAKKAKDPGMIYLIEKYYTKKY